MAKNKKRRRPAPRPVTPTSATIACILGTVTLCVTSTAWGPEETVFVLEDWEPTENYLQCRRGGAAR